MRISENDRALPISLAVEGKDAPPTSSEDPIERVLRLYSKESSEDVKRLLQDDYIRAHVLNELREMGANLRLLERMSEVVRDKEQSLGIPETKSLLCDRIESALRTAVYHKKIRTDSMTDSGSLAAYHEDVQKAMKRSIETGQALWCIAVDMDGLKGINDLYGHDAGNQALSILTARMKRAVRNGDAIYRVGGDEFIVLSYVEDENAAKTIAERLLKAVGSEVFAIHCGKGVRRISVSISVGISQFDQGEQTMTLDERKEIMEKRADGNLYLAKGHGKNCAYMQDAPVEGEQGPISVNF